MAAVWVVKSARRPSVSVGGPSALEIRGFVYSRADRRLARRLNERVFAHILRLPFRFHLVRQIGAVTQSLTNGLLG